MRFLSQLFPESDDSDDAALAMIKRVGGELLHCCGQTSGPKGRLVLCLTPVVDDDLALLVNMLGIREVDLLATGITDRGLRHLGQMRQLENLRLEKTPITDDGLGYLVPLLHLTDLDISGGNSHGTREQMLAHRNAISDAGISHLVQMPSLEVLSLEATRVKDAGIARLVELPRLEFLGLRCTDVTDLGLLALSESESLRRLVLGVSEITDDGLCAYGNQCPSITYLQVSDTPISDAGLRAISRLPSLTNLFLLRTNVTASGLSALEDLPLHDLTIDLEYSDTVYHTLCQLPYLERLWIGAVKDDDLARLAELTSLTDLSFDGSQVTDRGLDSLHRLENLEILRMGFNRITSAGWQRFKTALPDCFISVPEQWKR